MNDYENLLKEKVYSELNAFIDELKKLPSEMVIDKAYEKVLKEDFVACVEGMRFDNTTAKALYQKKNTLDYIYSEWMKTDITYTEVLENSLDLTAQKAAKEMRINQKYAR